jgi:hypothetical protein
MVIIHAVSYACPFNCVDVSWFSCLISLLTFYNDSCASDDDFDLLDPKFHLGREIVNYEYYFCIAIITTVTSFTAKANAIAIFIATTGSLDYYLSLNDASFCHKTTIKEVVIHHLQVHV